MNYAEIKIFENYPDIVTFEDMRVMLGGKNKKLGRTTSYNLIKNNLIPAVKVAREYRIQKADIIKYLLNN